MHGGFFAYDVAVRIELVEQAGKTGEFEEARILLDEAMEYDDEDAATLDNYGEYYRLLGVKAAAEGDAEEAAKLRAKAKYCFERAFKAKANQVTTLYALAKFAVEDGETARARELLDKAILHSSSRICPVSIEELQQMKAELA